MPMHKYLHVILKVYGMTLTMVDDNLFFLRWIDWVNWFHFIGIEDENKYTDGMSMEKKTDTKNKNISL